MTINPSAGIAQQRLRELRQGFEQRDENKLERIIEEGVREEMGLRGQLAAEQQEQRTVERPTRQAQARRDLFDETMGIAIEGSQSQDPKERAESRKLISKLIDQARELGGRLPGPEQGPTTGGASVEELQDLLDQFTAGGGGGEPSLIEQPQGGTEGLSEQQQLRLAATFPQANIAGVLGQQRQQRLQTQLVTALQDPSKDIDDPEVQALLLQLNLGGEFRGRAEKAQQAVTQVTSAFQGASGFDFSTVTAEDLDVFEFGPDASQRGVRAILSAVTGAINNPDIGEKATIKAIQNTILPRARALLAGIRGFGDNEAIAAFESLVRRLEAIIAKDPLGGALEESARRAGRRE